MNFICHHELFILMYSFQSSSGVAKQAIEVILILLRPVFQEREKGTEVVTDTIRSGLQLLGNTVVKNIDTQEFIWNCCCSQFFLDVLLSRHHSIQDCLCMIIFNCLNQQRRLQLVNNPKIISHIVHLCADKSLLEWGYATESVKVNLFIGKGRVQQKEMI